MEIQKFIRNFRKKIVKSTIFESDIATPCFWLSSIFTGGIFSGQNMRNRLYYHGTILNGLNIRDRQSWEMKNLRDI